MLHKPPSDALFLPRSIPKQTGGAVWQEMEVLDEIY
jgi:hypothetical protein